MGEQATRFHVGDVAKNASIEILPHVSEWSSSYAPTSSVGGGYDEVFFVFHYYNIPQERHFVKGWRYDCE